MDAIVYSLSLILVLALKHFLKRSQLVFRFTVFSLTCFYFKTSSGCFYELRVLTSSHLEFLQHGRLICEAQVAAADAELLGELIEVHLRKNREDHGRSDGG